MVDFGKRKPLFPADFSYALVFRIIIFFAPGPACLYISSSIARLYLSYFPLQHRTLHRPAADPYRRRMGKYGRLQRLLLIFGTKNPQHISRTVFFHVCRRIPHVFCSLFHQTFHDKAKGLPCTVIHVCLQNPEFFLIIALFLPVLRLSDQHCP